jgi:hypothetical protein
MVLMPRPQRPWFRFYTEAVHDRKLRRLPPAQRWLWVCVLAVARQSPIPGFLMLSVDGPGDMTHITYEDLVDIAAIKLSDVDAGMKAFRDLGMIVHDPNLGCDQIAKWSDRQFDADDVTSRTRRYRSKDPTSSPPNGPDGNGVGTFQSRSQERSESVRGTPPESESESESEDVSSQSSTNGCTRPPTDDDRLANLWKAWAHKQLHKRRADGLTDPANTGGWLRTVARDLADHYEPAARAVLAELPTADANELLERLTNPPKPQRVKCPDCTTELPSRFCGAMDRDTIDHCERIIRGVA